MDSEKVLPLLLHMDLLYLILLQTFSYYVHYHGLSSFVGRATPKVHIINNTFKITRSTIHFIL